MTTIGAGRSRCADHQPESTIEPTLVISTLFAYGSLVAALGLLQTSHPG
ncbi:hypothetical protein MI149_30205 (plasmid) [Mycolicibacterium crocinum]|uniref:Uncharacterized protein n=1 Tax=Mycolicibacterium crocinum TaxID=388459 RepID=A0ABY3TXF2_9MYCO|nr:MULTISPECIES: hypothetical protein [Mycolicibacterium]ULN44769.1 hypothetical protein MI149_30205 [Mycolicibacterium crocinum]